MREAGVELLATIEDLAVMGFSGLPALLPRLARLRKDFIARARDNRPALVLLVDYPGFNLNLAEALRLLPYPPKVLYYIAPQVWAWRPGRVERMRRTIDRMAVVLAFEEEYFRSRGLAADFVGHPLLDELSDVPRREVGGVPLLALLPGSRAGVLKRNLPAMIEAVRILRKSLPDMRVALAAAPGLPAALFAAASNSGIEITADSRALLRQATAAAVCSGTATLEAAIYGTPQAVVYRTSPLNYLIARRVVELKQISLVNIIGSGGIVTELIQHDFTPKRLAGILEQLINDAATRTRIAAGYQRVREVLGQPGAALRTARIATQMITSQN